MKSSKKEPIKGKVFIFFAEHTLLIYVFFGLIILLIGMYYVSNMEAFVVSYNSKATTIKHIVTSEILPEQIKSLDTTLYDAKLLAIANNPVPKVRATSTASTTKIVVEKKYLYPVKTVYPNARAILPFSRVIAYYGNFYSTGMGALGAYPPEEMLTHLKAEVKKWQDADPQTPVIPAIHYIAVTAQGSAGADGKYILRMPDDQIEKAIRLADEVHGIVFLDIQVGLSTFAKEIPLLEKFLKLPNVHLGLDPEFSMKNGNKPGSVIGTMDATDVNYAANYLATLVKDNNLPPKILVIHRFTHDMLTNYKQIKVLPEVQIVIHMDGWGTPEKKFGTYNNVVVPEPVEFTGFKLFYKNDLKSPSTHILSPQELLKLSPQPIYIQYQ